MAETWVHEYIAKATTIYEKDMPVECKIVLDIGEGREEIVRCKDCKYFRNGSHIYPYIYQCWRTTIYGNPVIYPTTPDDFCSKGERREDGDNDNGGH